MEEIVAINPTDIRQTVRSLDRRGRGMSTLCRLPVLLENVEKLEDVSLLYCLESTQELAACSDGFIHDKERTDSPAAHRSHSPRRASRSHVHRVGMRKMRGRRRR